MTKDELRHAVEHARQHDAVRTVQTEEEARKMTAEDPIGRVWRVGDEYYDLNDLRRQE